MVGDFVKRAIAKVAKPTCPQCGERIASADLNLTQGTMLCRACGHLSVIRVDGEGITQADRINASSRNWTPDADPVPQPKKSQVRLVSTARHLRIHRSRRHWGVAFFLLFWLTGWTVGCVFLILQVIEEPSGENLLFAMIFGAPWFLVAAIFLYMLTGYETLTLTSSRIARRAGMVLLGRNKSVPLDQIRTVSSFSYVQNSESNTRAIGLEILTTGRTIQFGKGLSEDEIRWLVDKVKRYLARHEVDLGSGKQETSFAAGGSGEVSIAAGHLEVLRGEEPPIRRPAHTGFRYHRGFNEIVLQRRGTWKGNWGGLFGLTLMMMFWNGIISIFVIQLFNHFDLFSFIFLIPFELIGLAILLGWFAMLTAPLWTRRFTFDRGVATRRLAWAFFAYKTRYAFGDLDRIELRSAPRASAGGGSNDGFGVKRGERFSLALVETTGEDALEINALTEADGRWIGDQLLRDLPTLGISIRT